MGTAPAAQTALTPCQPGEIYYVSFDPAVGAEINDIK